MMDENQKKKQSAYRNRKQVIKDCVECGAMSETEAEIINKTISRADKAVSQGKMFIDLKPYNSILTKKFEEKVEKGELTDNQRKTLHLLRVANISKPRLNEVAEVEKCCENYMEVMVQDDMQPTINGLSLAMGVSIKDLKAIESGELKYPCREVVKKYIQLMATSTELNIVKGGAVGAMFIGKNYFSMTDKTEVVHTEKKVEMTDDELKEKYQFVDVVDVDSTDK